MEQLRKSANRLLRGIGIRGDSARYRKSGVNKHYAGNLFERFQGLEPVLQVAQGKTVLDFGCCEGLISYEFARAGCSLVHGFDIDGPLMEFAGTLFRNVPVTSSFVQQDLSVPFADFTREYSALLLSRYDIVLFLGIYHHLEKQMSPEALREVVEGLLARTGTYFVARTARLDAFEQLILNAGFDCISESLGGVVGPLRIYRRKNT